MEIDFLPFVFAHTRLRELTYVRGGATPCVQAQLLLSL